MNSRLFYLPVLMLAVVSLASSGARSETASATPEPEIITGEVISLCNFLAKGHLGESNAEEGRFLVEKKGLPVAILAEDGEIYIAILKGFNRANEKFAPFLGKKVNARGTVYRHPGANLIEVQIVSEAL
jgi:hypothetical protein